MTDLVGFLRARLDEDERAAGSGLGWEVESTNRYHVRVRPAEDAEGQTALVAMAVGGDAGHIARHDPARVLREVERDRRIIELHGIVHRNIGWLKDGDEEYGEIPVCGLCVPKHSHYQRREEVPEGPCLTVRLLALPHDDHSDYREEWHA
jgi:hypothetical protein